jgi:uncharacterized protein DUF6526
MAQKEQSFANHTRIDPVFHRVLFPVAVLFVIAAIVQTIRLPDWWGVVRIAGAIWAVVLTLKIRLYALKVQDRIIRLEERLRMAEVLPEPLRGRAGEFSEAQLIGLRFASDAELAGLCEKTLAGNWDQKQIKKSIQTWRPDYWRV